MNNLIGVVFEQDVGEGARRYYIVKATQTQGKPCCADVIDISCRGEDEGDISVGETTVGLRDNGKKLDLGDAVTTRRLSGNEISLLCENYDLFGQAYESARAQR